MTKKQQNKIKHSENGNIRKSKEKVFKKFKILHLNKSSKFLVNSKELINDLISREDPDKFSLIESNIKFSYNEDEIGPAYKNYNIELKVFWTRGLWY